MSLHTYKVKIEPLAYIHIGSGDKLDPTDYIIKNRFVYYLNKPECIRFFLSKYKNAFQEIIKTANLNQICKYFYSHFDEKQRQLWTSRFEVGAEFEKQFVDNLGKENNQNLIIPFIRTGLSDTPYLPGSSIKGSLRTAIVSALTNNRNNEDDSVLQARLLHYMPEQRRNPEIERDPFKYIKIGDFPLPNEHITLKISSVEKKQIKQQRPVYLPSSGLPSRPPQTTAPNSLKGDINETTEVINYKAALQMEGLVSVDSQFFNNNGIAMLLNEPGFDKRMENLLQTIKRFYSQKFEKDRDFFAENKSEQYLKVLDNTFNKLQSNQCIVRIGKGSGKIFLTYAWVPSNPLTRKLIEKEPMGWCKLTFNH